jgi:hypothetical protein
MRFPRLALALLALATLLPTFINAQQTPAKPSVYAPYEFLIGEWDVYSTGITASHGTPNLIMRFKWGTNKSFIWFTTSLLRDGKEDPHFEGMLMWNGVHKNLDMLLALDLNGGRAQEQGDFIIEPDGTVVRRITMYSTESTNKDGKVIPAGTATFRQTFKQQDANTLVTTVMREQKDGTWIASFPGSEKLLMRRR